MSPKEIIQAFVDAVNNQNRVRLRVLLAEDFVRHSIAAGEPGIHSREDLSQFLRSQYDTFADNHE